MSKKDMGSVLQTVVCVKQVKQEVEEDWDESMPLPGDIIEGFSKSDFDDLFLPAKSKSDLSSQLGNVGQQFEVIWLKVRRGGSILRLRARIVQEKASILQKKFTIRADKDDRHVAVLGDLTLQQCTDLQEMSRRVINVDGREYNKRGIKYDWKMKLDMHLPDQRSSVVSSILFTPLPGEYTIDAPTARCMAWFSAAVSSGVPLVFVNIQSEQIIISEKNNTPGKEIWWSRQQNYTTNLKILQGVRLWFLPGISEIQLELVPKGGEVRFGMDIKRTEEGFICVNAVTKGSAAERAGLGSLHEEAMGSGQLLLISRLEGKSLIPSDVSSTGMIYCCDHTEIRNTLVSAINKMDKVQLHIMAWPNQTCPTARSIGGAAMLQPPNDCFPPGTL